MHKNNVVRLAIASALTGAGIMRSIDSGYYAFAAIVAFAFASVVFAGWRTSQ